MSMMEFDADQQRVLSLSTREHARVLGAAGSGKTLLITHLMSHWFESGDFAPGEVLVMTHRRQDAARLRDRIEAELPTPVLGTFVRTATSLALAICNAHRVSSGNPVLQLMMGSRQDEVIRLALHELPDELRSGMSADILGSVSLRTELRDLWRVLDDHAMSPPELIDYADRLLHKADSSDHLQRLAQRWKIAAHALERSQKLARERHPHERTASGILREAVQVINRMDADRHDLDVPRLIIVDDAAELGEGALALCAALSNVGSRIWFFGDPDTSTASFQGRPARVLAGVHTELARRGAKATGLRTPEQVIVLGHVHRHGHALRDLMRSLSERVGTAGGWKHRLATTAAPHESLVEFVTSHTFSEQTGMIAYRLRHRYLGLHDKACPVPWHDMAVICRSSDHVEQIASALEELKVPTETASGGTVLGHVPLVRHFLLLLQDALGLSPLTGSDIVELLLGQIGGLDPVSIRRLDHALTLAERREAFIEQRAPESLAERYLASIEHGDSVPDLAEGRALRKVARVIHAGRRVEQNGGTPREVLWALWSESRLSEILSSRASASPNALSKQAHRDLDAMIDLFFVFQRHEEHDSDVLLREVIEELLSSEVPQDSIATRSKRSAVTVTTPQGVTGREFRVVCIAGPQEGIWPNMKSRGTLTGAHDLENLLRGEEPLAFDRTQVLHDELRLFINACSRASHELLVVAREDEEEFPSPFFYFGGSYITEPLPNNSLTLRGYTAELRRRMLVNPADAQAAQSLKYLATQAVDGADPHDWYGVLPASSHRPLADLSDPGLSVRVSPSRIETAEECPLHWFLSTYASEGPSVTAHIGTLLHHALEVAHTPNELELRAIIDEHWPGLSFEAPWQEEQARIEVDRMIEGLAEYVRDADAKGTQLAIKEASFSLTIGQTQLHGTADRIEMVPDHEGQLRPYIVDVKTGRSFLSQAEAEENPQLLAYQLGLLEAEFARDQSGSGEDPPHKHYFGETAGAALLYVHPRATTTKHRYRVVQQAPVTPEQAAAFKERVSRISEIMAAAVFRAEVEHHCLDPHAFGACKIHIIPAVSYE